MKKIHLVVIDPQNDFMDTGALPVGGANADMDRLALMVKQYGDKLDDIHVTMDSHRSLDVSHAPFWMDSNGKHPTPFTPITHQSILDGVWRPTIPTQELLAHVKKYTAHLEAQGRYVHMIWPTHCLIGSPGHAVQSNLFDALQNWEDRVVGNVNFVVKGDDYRVEHFGGLQAEMVMDDNPRTGLNTDFLTTLGSADIILIAGEAFSHCVKATVQQIVDNIGDQHLQKIHILRDCSTSIPKVGAGPDFPAITEAWLADIVRNKNLTVTDSVNFWK